MTIMNFAEKGTVLSDSFSLEDTKAVQGLFAFCITVHHFALWADGRTDYNGVLDCFLNIGILLVGFFFFCSGYGLITSLRQNTDYLRTFLIRRMLTVLVPFFICNYIYMILVLIKGFHFSSGELIAAFFGFLLLNDQMWFAVEILILYLLFFVFFRFIKNEKLSFMLMGSSVVVLILVSLLLGHSGYTEHIAGKWFHGEWWYNTTLLFFAGMLFGRFSKQIKQWLNSHYLLLLFLSILLFLPLWIENSHILATAGYWTETPDSMAYADKFTALAVQIPLVFCFVFLLFLLMQKLHISSRLLSFLGGISLEMILINKAFLVGLEGLSPEIGYILYYLLVTLCTITGAFIVNKVKLWILNRHS